MATNQRELCRYFLSGACRFGSSCFNSHDRNDRPSTVCQYYLKGCCAYGNSCRYDHVKPPRTSNSTTTNDSISNNNNNSNIKINRMIDNSGSHVNMLVLNKSQINKDDNNSSNKQSNENNNIDESLSDSNKSYFEALTGTKQYLATNLNDESIEYNPFDENTHKIMNASNYLNPIDQLCPYFEKEATCPFGYECQYIHGEMCELCNTPSLHPRNQEQREQHKQECMKQLEKEMEEAFASQRSQEKQCGICMDIVWEKEKTDQCFGILENCNHIFCLPCIRKWRASKTYENKIVKACPECRVKSDYVTPSRFWFENEDEKTKIIEEYKNKLGKTACKYFKQGAGHCPFGNKCFYQHLYPDGTKADLPSPTQRRRLNRNGVLESFSNLVRVDFELSDDDSDYELIELLRQNLMSENIDTESELSDLSISDFFDEYIYYYN